MIVITLLGEAVETKLIQLDHISSPLSGTLHVKHMESLGVECLRGVPLDVP